VDEISAPQASYEKSYYDHNVVCTMSRLLHGIFVDLLALIALQECVCNARRTL
jgi:hypothetical protein